ncbi:MAG: Lipoprotein signal peptidase [Chlamydiae bacterium]|nr:Lipoprotein signal peptidase [Chlamydiota bacterium]
MYIFLSLLLFLSDGYVKYLTWAHLPHASMGSSLYPYGGVGVFQNFMGIDFALNSVTNQGAAWGLFSAFPNGLLILRIVILTALFIYAVFVDKERKRSLPFLLILTGAFSNILDSFIYGSVIDMFHFVLWGYSYPVFNLADMMIFFGVATLLLQSLLEKFKSRRGYETQRS